MVKTLKTVCLLFVLLTLFIDSHTICADGFLEKNGQVIQLAVTLILGCGPIIYRHFYERNPEAERLKIENQKLLNEEKNLSNKKLEQKLEQEIDYNKDPEVQKNKKKLLAAKAILQSEPRWIKQELQIRAQELEKQSIEQRIIIFHEIDIVKSLASGGSLDNKEKFDSIMSGLLNRYNKLVQGVDFATVRVGLSGNDEDNGE